MVAALATIQAQSLHAFECVLVDNASSDDSRGIAETFVRRDARFRLVDRPGSFIDALNAGVREARTPIIARMDADDLAHPERLERQLALLHADASLTVASSLVASFSPSGVRTGMQRYTAWLNRVRTPTQIRNALFIESPLVHPSVMVTRAAVEAAGGYVETGGPEDYDLWMRLLLGGHRAAKVPTVLLRWRDSPGRLTRTHPRYAADRLLDLKLRYFPQAVPLARSLQLWGAGPIGRRWARSLSTIGYRISRFIDVDTRKIGRTRYGVPIEAPSALSAGDGFVLAAVGSPGARDQIEAFLQARGLRPWDDYLAVA